MKSITVSAPANIAFIKYWGKKDAAQQIPYNSSLSMTLENARTITKIEEETELAEHQIIFSQEKNSVNKINKPLKHLKYLASELGFKKKLRVTTYNTFPTGSGIASSASGLAALTLGSLCFWLEASSLTELEAKGFPLTRIALLSKMGSGSACRSLFAGFVKWELNDNGHSEVIPLQEQWKLCDTILLVSKHEKTVPSSLGHLKAPESILFFPRLKILPERTKQLENALQKKDIEALGQLLETEALEMHAIMLSTEWEGQRINYLTQETIEWISWLRETRQKENLKAYFTLDAGPNLHIICEEKDVTKLAALIKQKAPNQPMLLDKWGKGPQILEVLK